MKFTLQTKMLRQSVIILFLYLKLIHCVEISDISRFIVELSVQIHSACIDVLHANDNNTKLLNDIKFYLAKNKLFAGEMTYDDWSVYRSLGFNEISCYKPLIFSLSDDESRRKLEEASRTYPITQSVWLILMSPEMNLNKYFANIFIPFDALLFAVVPFLNEPGFFISEVYRVREGSQLRQNILGTWTRHKGLNMTTPKVNLRRNFEGYLFRVGAVENWPVSSFERKIAENEPVDGYYARVWWELGDILNFTQNYSRADRDESGTLRPDGKWSGIVGMMINDQIDAIIAELNINTERIKILDFLQPLTVSYYQIYYKSAHVLDLKAVFRPLHYDIWATLGIWIIVGGVFLYIVSSFIYHCGIDVRQTEKSLINTTLFVLQALCQQGCYIRPKSLSVRILFLLSYAIPSVIIPSYSASLISSLSRRAPFRPYESLRDILNAQLPIITGEETAEYDYFKRSSDPLHYEIFTKLVEPVHKLRMVNQSDLKGYHRSFMFMCEHDGLALFGVESSIEMKIRATNECKMVKFSNPVSKVYQSIALKKGNPFTKTLNYHTIRLFEAGIVQKQIRTVLPLGKPNSAVDTDKKLVVTFLDVAEIFLVLFSGNVLAVIICIFELLYKKKWPIQPSNMENYNK